MKRYQTGGLLDSEGNPVRDGSGQPIMTGYGREEAETEARMEAARNKLAGEVQEMVKTKKSAPSNDGDVDERDRRMEAAASAPSRMPTRPGQSSSGRMMGAAPKTKQTPKAKDTSMDSAIMAGEARKRQKPVSAVMVDESRKRQNAQPRVMNDEARKRKPGKDQAQEKARLKQMEKDQALQRVTPELALMGGASGFGLKALHSAAKNLAGTGAKTASKTMTTGAKSPLREKTERLIREDKNPGRSFSSTSASPKVSLKEKTKELIQGDRTAKSNELSRQMAEKQKPTKFTSKKSTSAGKPVASKRTKKFNEEEAGIDFKRGGKVGGSSASRRADGIAQRGKTRGKVY